MPSNTPKTKGPHSPDFPLKRRIRLWLRDLFHGEQSERELDSELHFHVEAQAEAYRAAGMSPEDARNAALRDFGGVQLAREECHDARGTRWLEDLWQDARYGLRMLRKSPGFTTVAILTLALGIGANTAIFSVVDGVLLNPLPYADPDQLVTLHASKTNFPIGSISYPNFLDWHRDNHCFSGFAVTRGYGFNLTGAGEAEQVRAELVTSDFFPIFGVKPLMGRTFTPAEDEIGVGNVVAISYALWERKFHSAQDILGKSITLDGKAYVIAAVIPSNINLPLRNFAAIDVYAPLGEWPNTALRNRGAGLGIHGVGRLKPGVTIEQARADMQAVTQHLAEVYPNIDRGTGASMSSLKEEMVGSVRPFLLLLLGAVGLVLLIACVNVANLLLARSTGRTKEIAVRSALGAGTGRLVRQMVTESVILALAGGALGLLLARWGTRAALGALPAALPRAGEVKLDARVLLFTLLVSACAGILFGIFPAVRTARRNIHDTLKESGRGASGKRHRAQGTLVIVEMALALVLLIGAGLLIRSLAALWNVDPGFRPENVLTFSLTLPPAIAKGTPDSIRAAIRDLNEKLSSTPGVAAASLTWGALPLGAEDDMVFWVDNQPRPATQNDMSAALNYIVGPDYLKVMGIPLKSGRFFTAHDDEHSLPVAVVDEVFARKFFPKGDAIGGVIDIPSSDSAADKFRIVGVIGHVKQWGLDSDDTNSVRAQMYFPVMQMGDNSMIFVALGTGVVVRSNGADPAVLESIRATSSKMSSEQVIYGARSMTEIIAASLASRRFSMMLLGAFAALALILASIGLYGVIAYLVGQRTHEIGIRMALGAQRGDILRWVLGRAVRMALIGILFGLAAAAGLTRLLQKSSLLFGVSPTDPLTFAGVAALLLIVALAACWIPARRAMRVDPIVALRYE